jgi:subtilase family protein
MTPAEERVRQATNPRVASALPARYALETAPGQDPRAVAAEVAAAFPDLRRSITPLSDLDPDVLVVEFPRRTFEGASRTEAFATGYRLAAEFALVTAEPDLPTGYYTGEADDGEESVGSFPPGCFVPGEPALDPRWALDRLRVPEAWAFSTSLGRPSQGAGSVVAQPDTGVVTDHPELRGVLRVAAANTLDGGGDPTDPRSGRNPGHGTGTASVLVSSDELAVSGSAPRAGHMPIRAIDSVIRVTQVTVAKAIDWAVAHGAQVITMSLGGLPAASLHRAVKRAVAADVIVLAAAGNCVRTVVWPARYDECIAVGGTNAADRMWSGSCRGSAVDISAPAQNVLRAGMPAGSGQGQGTSFAVALVAGVAALWLAHHGRASLIAAAHSRGESLQDMFRRLARATARRPAGWPGSDLGAGIVDANALLRAGLDQHLDRESVESLPSVVSLVAESAGLPAARDDVLDWHRFGPELADIFLSRTVAARKPTEESPIFAATSESLAGAVTNPALRDALQLEPAREQLGTPSAAAPQPERATRNRTEHEIS